jgi:hypothetical protein
MKAYLLIWFGVGVLLAGSLLLIVLLHGATNAATCGFLGLSCAVNSLLAIPFILLLAAAPTLIGAYKLPNGRRTAAFYRIFAIILLLLACVSIIGLTVVWILISAR